MITPMRSVTLVIGFAVANALAQTEAAPEAYSSEVRPLIDRMAADRASLLRTYNLVIDAARSQRLKQFHSQWIADLQKLRFASLSPEGKVDYLLLPNDLAHEIRELEAAESRRPATDRFTPFAPAILALEHRRRSLEAVSAQEAAASLDAL